MNELPTITSSIYTSNTTSAGDFVSPLGEVHVGDMLLANHPPPIQTLAAHFQHKDKPMANATRIVKVFIADPTEDLPLESRILYTGPEKLTDQTDQELFFELPMADLMAKHNEVRKRTLDRKMTDKFGRDIFLQVGRIRDLKMIVVTVAQF